MMKEKRIFFLEQEIEKNPSDPFFKYALALEYQESHPDKSLELYWELKKKHPDYLPTYYQLASLLQALGKDREAVKSTFEEGIQLAHDQNDQKALQELKNSYQNWLFEM